MKYLADEAVNRSGQSEVTYSMTTTRTRWRTIMLTFFALAACTSNPGDSTASESTAVAKASTDSATTEFTATEPTAASEPASAGTTRISAASQAANEQALLDLAAALDVTRLAAWSPTSDDGPRTIVTVDGSSASTIDIADGWAWADANFIYTTTYNGSESSSSAVLTYDGTIVCEVLGEIHHATRRPDGSIIAAVDTSDDSVESPEWTSVAFDCATGTTQPIEPWIERTEDESGAVVTKRVADECSGSRSMRKETPTAPTRQE
ncbi:MAG: hypothetical protein R2706_10275 [Acidimicrobiales bacterium]